MPHKSEYKYNKKETHKMSGDKKMSNDELKRMIIKQRAERKAR